VTIAGSAARNLSQIHTAHHRLRRAKSVAAHDRERSLDSHGGWTKNRGQVRGPNRPRRSPHTGPQGPIRSNQGPVRGQSTSF
jgi:hypothetical protein